MVAGNHELGFEDGEEMTDRQLAALSMLGINKAYELLTNCTYLCDQEIEVLIKLFKNLFKGIWTKNLWLSMASNARLFILSF